jgi:hypothetical protein
MKTLFKRYFFALLCLVPAFASTGLILWKAYSDPVVVMVLNWIFYGLISAIALSLAVFLFVLIVSCTNKALQLLLGKSALNTKTKKED